MKALAQQSSTALLATVAEGSLDGTWTLDPSKSSVSLKTKSMWGLVKINAVFTDLQGEIAVVAGAVTARIAVATGSIDTKNAKRDKHLKSDDFLAAEKFPHLIFVLSSVAPSPTAIQANGTLTVRDKTRPIVFEATVSTAGDSEITVTSELDVDRGDYDVSSNPLGAGTMNNSVSVTAVFTRA
jgi:polyisoprenoid-binding protein YceI